MLAAQTASSKNGEIPQRWTGKCLSSLLVFRPRFSSGSEDLDTRICSDINFVVRCFVEDKVADGRLELAAPIIAIMDRGAVVYACERATMDDDAVRRALAL